MAPVTLSLSFADQCLPIPFRFSGNGDIVTGIDRAHSIHSHRGSRCADSSSQMNGPRTYGCRDLRKVCVLQDGRQKARKRDAILFGLHNIVVRNKRRREVKFADCGVEGSGEESRYGQLSRSGQAEFSRLQRRIRAQACGNRQNVRNALPGERLSENEPTLMAAK